MTLDLLPRIARGFFLRLFIDYSPDAPVRLVAKRSDIRAAFAGFKSSWRWIVLDNVVVPVDHPDIAVGSYFGRDGGCPFIVAGNEIKTHATGKRGTLRTEFERSDDVSGGFCHKGRSIPIRFGIRASGIEPVTGGRCKSTVMIDLTNFCQTIACWCEFHLRGTGNAAKSGCAPALHAFIHSIGKRHVFARIAVGGIIGPPDPRQPQR